MSDSLTIQEVADAYRKAMADKDADIDRLNEVSKIKDLQIQQLIDHEQSVLLPLLIRAADALSKYTDYPIHMVMSVTLREAGREIIAELRKAAHEGGVGSGG